MLTPTRRLRAEIERQALLATGQRMRSRQGFDALQLRWRRALGRPRNLALGFGAGVTYGLLRSTQVRLPGRIPLWRLVRPLLLSSAMAWWGRRH